MKPAQSKSVRCAIYIVRMSSKSNFSATAAALGVHELDPPCFVVIVAIDINGSVAQRRLTRNANGQIGLGLALVC